MTSVYAVVYIKKITSLYIIIQYYFYPSTNYYQFSVRRGHSLLVMITGSAMSIESSVSIMIPLFKRLFLLTTIFTLVKLSDGGQFSTKDLFAAFGNPVKDLISYFSRQKYNETNVGAERKNMIQVPANNDTCDPGKKRDSNGVCREPWYE